MGVSVVLQSRLPLSMVGDHEHLGRAEPWKLRDVVLELNEIEHRHCDLSWRRMYIQGRS